MKQKLTLTIERKALLRGKRYSRKAKRSLSSILENYMNTLPDEKSKPKSLAESLIGIIRLPDGIKAEDIITKAIQEKHL